ncbi:MAG: NYN domain-containing protein [Demequinaceae bacterium]|nr:NYN domain-containing protein [Demequinaceae bacterium]
MPDRVVVFIDYENVYWGAREAFHPGAQVSGRMGHIDPVRLAKVIVGKSLTLRHLEATRIYRGMPSPSLDPRGYRAWRARTARWEKSEATVVARMLRYPSIWPNPAPGKRPHEKGIDVALALDVIDHAHRGAYDVAIIVSTDTDLLPTIEMLQRMRATTGKPRVEVAAWDAAVGYSPRLRIPGSNVWCHWLHEADYRQVQDLTDYTR